MSDFSIGNRVNIYTQSIDVNNQPSAIESNSSLSEVESAGEQITNECESKETQSQSEHRVEKEKPLNSEANMKDLSDATKKNLAKYLSKSCDIQVAGQNQNSSTAHMQSLVKDVANNPLGKAALGDELESKIADSFTQKNSGELPGGERVLAAQHNLEAFKVIAQDGDSTLRAACAANSIRYLDSLVDSMSLAIDSQLQSIALPYLACEDASEAKTLQGKLEQAIADLKQATALGSPQEQGLALVISDFVTDLIAQKNDSLELLAKTTFAGLEANIIDVKNLFAMEKNEEGKPSLVCKGQDQLNNLGAIANSQTDLLNTQFNNINHTAKTALEAIENNNLEQAKSSISLLGSQNKEAQALVETAYNKHVQAQIEDQANKIVNHILTPKSELKALKNAAKAQQAQAQNPAQNPAQAQDPAQAQNKVANKPTEQAKSGFDINKFNSDHVADLSTLYKNLSNLALPEGKKFNKIALLINQDATQNAAPTKGNKQVGAFSVSSEVYNKAVSLIKDEVSKHEGFGAKQQEQLKNIEAEIGKLKGELDALTTTNQSVDASGSTNPQAQEALAAKKAEYNNKINNCYKMMASVLRDGLENYVNSHVSGYDLAKDTLLDYGIDKNNALGMFNGGVSGLVNEMNYNRIAQHSLGDKCKDATEHILRGILDKLNISNQKQALANQKASAKQNAQANQGANASPNAQANQGANASPNAQANQGANASQPVPIDANLVAKEMLVTKGQEVLDNLHNNSNDSDKEKSFNAGRRLLGGYAAISENFGAVAHTIALGKNVATTDPNNASTTTNSSQDPASQDPAVINANNELARAEMEALYDLLSQDDSTALCDKVLTSAFAAQNEATLEDLSSLLQGVKKCYSHDETQSNRITNTISLVEKLSILKHNGLFSELGSANSVLNSVNNQGMNNLKDAYANFKSDPSSQNMLQLGVAIHNLKAEDIVLDVASFRAEAEAQVNAQSQAQGKNTKNPIQSVDAIAQNLCNAKTNQLKSSLSLLDEHGEHLVDMAYDKFQLDNNIKLDTRSYRPENQAFFESINQASPNIADTNYLSSFMSDGMVRGDSFSAYMINSLARTMAKTATMPTIRDLIDNINPDLSSTQKRNVVLNYFFDKYATQEFKDKLASMSGDSVSKIYDAMANELAKNWGSNKDLIALGLAHGLESNFDYVVDSKSSTMNQSLTVAGVDQATAQNYLSKDAFNKNEGETQAAAIKLATAMVVDSDFTSCDISSDLVAKYLNTNANNAPNNNATIDGINNQERDIFLAMEEARKGNLWLTDGSCLVRALYKEYQASHTELNGVDFNQLEPDQYQAMLDHYYGKFNMSTPREMAVCGPGNNSSALAMTNNDKAKALECLSKAICKNDAFKTLDQAAKTTLDQNFKSAISILGQKTAPTADQLTTLKNNFAAIYNQLAGDQNLLKVCDYVMINKSVTNAVIKDNRTTDQTRDRMLSKVFGSGVFKAHNAPNELARKVQSRLSFASVESNYMDSKQIKNKLNLIRSGEAILMKQILADKQSRDLLKTGLHMAFLDVAQLYGNSSVAGFKLSHLPELMKSAIVNNNKDDISASNQIKAQLEITPEQIETLREKGIDVTVVKLDSKGNEIASPQNTGVQPSEANSDHIELKVFQNADKQIHVALNDLLAANLATHINVDEHNEEVMQKAEDLNMPKDASGNFIHKVQGLVTRQEIATGMMNVAARDPNFADNILDDQASKQLHVRAQNKLNLIQEHFNNLVLSVKNGTNFSDDWSRVKNRELQKRENENIGLIADVLFSIESDTAVTFNNTKKLKLLSFEKTIDLDKAEANFSAEISSVLKDGFCITKENGSYKFTVSKELAAKAGISASVGVEAKTEDLPAGMSFSASAEASLEANVEAQVGGALSFEFENEKEAALFMHHLMIHNIDQSELNRASLEMYVGAEASLGIEASTSMIFNVGEKKEEEEDENSKNAWKKDGYLAHQHGFATEERTANIRVTEEKDPQSYGGEAKLSFTCNGKGSYSLINEPDYSGYKINLAGSIVCSAEATIGDLAEDAVNQVSLNKGATFQYDVTTEVRVGRSSNKLESCTRTETYQINFDNDLIAVLTMQGVPKAMIESILAAHQQNPISEISFNCTLKEGLELSPKDPAIKNKINYDTTSVVIKFSEEKDTDYKSIGFLERTKSVATEKSLEINMVDLRNEANAKTVNKVLTKNA